MEIAEGAKRKDGRRKKERRRKSFDIREREDE